MLQQFSSFLTAQKSSVSKSTLHGYVHDVTAFMIWFEKTFQQPFQPSEIKEAHIEAYRKKAPGAKATTNRHLSSLRKFFHFLKTAGMITHTPFAHEKTQEPLVEKWKLVEFATYLSLDNASALTIKWYLMDIKHFLRWVETEQECEATVLPPMEAYNQSLLQQYTYSQATLRRKQAAVRKYLLWYAP